MLIESLARKTTTDNEEQKERERESETADSMIYGDYSTSFTDNFAFSISLSFFKLHLF